MTRRPQRTVVRSGVSLVVLAACLYAGAFRVGPVPPLGPFLHPTLGVWAVATLNEIPRDAGVTVPGAQESVQVVFDDRAVPHVFARNVPDAYRALGYLHARFRLFQLELQTRVTAGRLSEWLGERALEFDRRQRALGLAWSAERDFAQLDSTSRAAILLRAYADGVNARIAELGPGDRPLEYRLLGVAPAPWEAVHTVYLIKRMGYTLAYWHPDRRFERLAALVGPAAAAALLPVNSPIQEPIVPTGQSVPRYEQTPLPPPQFGTDAGLPNRRGLPPTLGASAAKRSGGLMAADRPPSAAPVAPAAARGGSGTGLPWMGGEDVAGSASNNWVVSAARTADGYPLLAGDPHLDLTLPSIWYEAHLVVPESLDVYGVTFPGAPAVPIGFTRDVAWSFTNTGADVLDYYDEQVDDVARPTRYRLDGRWVPLEVREEVYRGRANAELMVDTVYFTHRGPVLLADSSARSMRWTVLEEQGAIAAMGELVFARDVDDWLAAMSTYRAPIQNGAVADRAGNIAMFSPGTYPIRPGNGRGLTAFDGSSSAVDWEGYLPGDRVPFARNPPQGFLVSANQQPVDPRSDPFYFGASWVAPWRAMRINHLLRNDAAVTPDAMRRYQTDPGSERAEFFATAMLDAARRYAPPSERDRARLATAAALLAEWDGRYSRDNERAVLFVRAMDALNDRVWDELSLAGDTSGRRVFTPGSDVLAGLVLDPRNVWWDDRRTVGHVESRDEVLAASLLAGYDLAVARYGDPAGGGWRWERVWHANIYHLLRFPSLSALEIPVPGGPATISPLLGDGTHGASWRMVVQLGPEVRAWGTYPGGQSGNPLSPWYDDRIAQWAAGTLDTLLVPRTADDLPSGRVLGALTLHADRRTR